jgi:hypothetical protein
MIMVRNPRQSFQGQGIVVAIRAAGPNGIFVELHGIASGVAKDHRAQSAIANG